MGRNNIDMFFLGLVKQHNSSDFWHRRRFSVWLTECAAATTITTTTATITWDMTQGIGYMCANDK